MLQRSGGLAADGETLALACVSQVEGLLQASSGLQLQISTTTNTTTQCVVVLYYTLLTVQHYYTLLILHCTLPRAFLQ